MNDRQTKQLPIPCIGEANNKKVKTIYTLEIKK